MIDIQAPTQEFLVKFALSNATVGQVGYGFIGDAVVELFRPHCKVVVYDKAGYEGKPDLPNVTKAQSLDDVVSSAEVIFVAVPTPMKPSGECHTGIVEDVLQQIQNTAAKVGRDLGSFVVVIKSTVPPGFTKKMQERLALRILFSPEFLTEKNAREDFRRTNRVILGGDTEDARILFKYFEGVWPDRIALDPHPDGPVHIIQCEPTVAEMVKLSTNVHLTARVMISNELYLICQKLGVLYDDVKKLTQCDPRIGLSHMDVPGPDGHLGYGGHCFVKDTQNLGHIADQLGTSTQYANGSDNLFKDLHQRNLQIRDDRDWEKQVGRAVIDD